MLKKLNFIRYQLYIYIYNEKFGCRKLNFIDYSF